MAVPLQDFGSVIRVGGINKHLRLPSPFLLLPSSSPGPIYYCLVAYFLQTLLLSPEQLFSLRMGPHDGLSAHAASTTESSTLLHGKSCLNFCHHQSATRQASSRHQQLCHFE